MPKRVLHCNWAPYWSRPLVGGGVSVYCKSLMDGLAGGERGWSPSFLCAGYEQQADPGPPHVRAVANPLHPGVPTFSMVDSPVPAPSVLKFHDPDGDVRRPPVEACFAAFLREHGPFDVVHFHNLEGLTADCLRVAKEAGARVVLSLHNYWTVCPQVQLWQYDDHACTDWFEGRGCAGCLRDAVETERFLAERRAGLPPRYEAVATPDGGTGPLASPLVVRGADQPSLVPAYRRRRPAIVGLVNECVDAALAVSERSAEVLAARGIDRSLLSTLYIGTSAAEFRPPPGNPAVPAPGAPFRLVYLGEARRDKGFFFLLDELRRLGDDELAGLHLTVACRVTEPAELRMAATGRGRLLSLAESLHTLDYRPGYDHASLPALLAGAHLGVVPPLWEDNLPQVALELIACRVPVLCSARGGAKEFVRHPAFVFDPGVDGDLVARLRALRADPALLADFWSAARPPTTVAAHLDELVAVYDRVAATDGIPLPGPSSPA
ncbi:MAG TPA: glycosyltransferase [Acidimicrobiales bacterium]|jgi:glycosyltransferase involved in cell wall biosynthesis